MADWTIPEAKGIPVSLGLRLQRTCSDGDEVQRRVLQLQTFLRENGWRVADVMHIEMYLTGELLNGE